MALAVENFPTDYMPARPAYSVKQQILQHNGIITDREPPLKSLRHDVGEWHWEGAVKLDYGELERNGELYERDGFYELTGLQIPLLISPPLSPAMDVALQELSPKVSRTPTELEKKASEALVVSPTERRDSWRRPIGGNSMKDSEIGLVGSEPETDENEEDKFEATRSALPLQVRVRRGGEREELAREAKEGEAFTATSGESSPTWSKAAAAYTATQGSAWGTALRSPPLSAGPTETISEALRKAVRGLKSSLPTTPRQAYALKVDGVDAPKKRNKLAAAARRLANGGYGGGGYGGGGAAAEYGPQSKPGRAEGEGEPGGGGSATWRAEKETSGGRVHFSTPPLAETEPSEAGSMEMEFAEYGGGGSEEKEESWKEKVHSYKRSVTVDISSLLSAGPSKMARVSDVLLGGPGRSKSVPSGALQRTLGIGSQDWGAIGSGGSDGRELKRSESETLWSNRGVPLGGHGRGNMSALTAQLAARLAAGGEHPENTNNRVLNSKLGAGFLGEGSDWLSAALSVGAGENATLGKSHFQEQIPALESSQNRRMTSIDSLLRVSRILTSAPDPMFSSLSAENSRNSIGGGGGLQGGGAGQDSLVAQLLNISKEQLNSFQPPQSLSLDPNTLQQIQANLAKGFHLNRDAMALDGDNGEGRTHETKEGSLLTAELLGAVARQRAAALGISNLADFGATFQRADNNSLDLPSGGATWQSSSAPSYSWNNNTHQILRRVATENDIPQSVAGAGQELTYAMSMDQEPTGMTSLNSSNLMSSSSCDVLQTIPQFSSSPRNHNTEGLSQNAVNLMAYKEMLENELNASSSFQRTQMLTQTANRLEELRQLANSSGNASSFQSLLPLQVPPTGSGNSFLSAAFQAASKGQSLRWAPPPSMAHSHYGEVLEGGGEGLMKSAQVDSNGSLNMYHCFQHAVGENPSLLSFEGEGGAAMAGGIQDLPGTVEGMATNVPFSLW